MDVKGSMHPLKDVIPINKKKGLLHPAETTDGLKLNSKTDLSSMFDEEAKPSEISEKRSKAG